MAVSGSFDTGALRDGASRLATAADLLRRLRADLRPDGFPDPVYGAVHNLGKRGGNLISAIADDAADLRKQLEQTAECYEALEGSLAARFGGTP
ncbi:hypothetical protein ACQP00_38440 [Dactylosporangium sp. CS-047395]|uniref:hypothetical protein n=1 Tax=Dactylosporangium sp. CS-047395 TaxID=3239936 RepID=UPI003D917504